MADVIVNVIVNSAGLGAANAQLAGLGVAGGKAAGGVAKTGKAASKAAPALGGAAAGAAGFAKSFFGPFGLIFGAAGAAKGVQTFAGASLALEDEEIKLQTQLGLTGKAAEGVGDQSKALAKQYGVDAATIAAGGFAIQSAGLRGAEGAAALEAATMGASIGLGSVNNLGRLAAGALQSWGASGLDAGRSMEIVHGIVNEGNLEAATLATSFGRLGPVAASMGISMEESGGAVAFMTRHGLSAEESVTAVRAAMSNLLKPGTAAQEVMAKAGYSLEDLHASIRERGLVPTLQDLNQKVTESGGSMADVLPNIRGLQFGLAAVGPEGDTLNGIISNIEGNVGSLDKAVQINAGSVRNQLAVAWQNIKIPLTDVMDNVLPLVATAFTTVAGAIEPAVAAAKEFGAPLWEALKLAWDEFKPVLEGLIAFWRDTLSPIFQWVANVVIQDLIARFTGIVETVTGVVQIIKGIFTGDWKLVWEGMKKMILGVLKSLFGDIDTHWENIKGIFTAAIEWIKTALSDAWEAVKTAASTAWTAIKDALNTAWEAIKTAASTVWNAIKGAFNTVIEGIKTIASNAWTAIQSALTTAWDAIKSAASTAWEAVKSTASTVWEAIKGVITGAIEAAKTALKTAWDAIKTAASTVWTGIKLAATIGWNAIKSAITTPVNSAKRLVLDAFGAVKSGLASIWDGVKSAASTAWDGIKSVISTAVNGIISGVNAVLGAWNSISVSIPAIRLPLVGEVFPGATLNTPNIPLLPQVSLAKGGIVTSPTIAQIGEAGPEAVIPLSRMRERQVVVHLHVDTLIGDGGPKLQEVIELAVNRGIRENRI